MSETQTRPRRTYYHDKLHRYFLNPETLTDNQVKQVKLLTFAMLLESERQPQDAPLLPFQAAMVLAAMQGRARDLQRKYEFRRTMTSILPPGQLDGTIRRVEEQVSGMVAVLRTLAPTLKVMFNQDKAAVVMMTASGRLDLPA